MDTRWTVWTLDTGIFAVPIRRSAFPALVIVLSAALGACSKPEQRAMPVETVPVRIGEVVSMEMPVQLSVFGAVEAVTTISVKAQVSGEITEVLFKEGDDVTKDQVLFEIDRRPYEVALELAEAGFAKAEAQVDQARANLARDKAQAENAKIELDRNAALLPNRMVSKEEYDTVRANADALQAAVVADEAAIRSASEAVRGAKAAGDEARIELDYCTIRSPIDGRTGSLLIHKGNLVKANDTNGMVVINQIQPIYVAFTIPEQYLLQLNTQRVATEQPLEVQALVPSHEDKPISGTLVFVDNAVDPNTGTIRLKASFGNEDRLLWPGQFVRVALNLAVRANAVAAPTQAIQNGQAGAYAFVVKADMTVEMRPVTTGETHEGLTEIKEGLQPGEKVVTDGQVRLKPGAPVKIAEN